MNGFMLLVLVVMAGQVSPGGLTMPPSSNPVQPASMIANPGPQRDYGWQINKDDGLLEYIVQIAPDKAEYMYKNSKEQMSTIPPVVAARVSRIIVRIGTEEIQSTPLEAVQRLPLVERNEIAENLPTGNFKNLENAGAYDVQNVAGGGTQPMPLAPGGIGASLSDAPTLTNDKIAEALRNPDNILAQSRTNGSNLLQDAMGARTGGAAPFPTAPATAPYGTSAGNSGMPTSTATTPPTGYGNAQTGLNGAGSSSVGLPGMGTAGMGTAGLSNNSSALGNAYGQSQTGAPAGAYTSLPAQTNTTLSGQTRPGFAAAPLGSPQLGSNAGWPAATGNAYNTTPGFGSTPSFNNTPNYNAQGTANPGYANNQGYPQSPSNQTVYPNGQTGSYLHSDPPSVRVADNRTAVPSTSTGNSGITPSRSNWRTGSDGYPVEGLTDGNGQLVPRTGMENIMPVMFVFSLVVNFYLGMLIRKLLGRYRTLLASVRSQTV